MSSRIFTKIDSFTQSSFWNLLNSWPKERPLLALGGNGSNFFMIGLRFREVCREEFLNQKVTLAQRDQSLFPFSTGYFTCLSYDDPVPGSTSSEDSKFFYVNEALLFNESGVVLVSEEAAKKEGDVSYSLTQVSNWLDKESLDVPLQKIVWEPKWSREEYLDTVKSCKEDIVNGRYYQINLLQYFSSNQTDIQWFPLFKKFSGPFAAWVRFGEFELISFSPERFFRFFPEGDRIKVVAEPIKGTIAVGKDPREDELNRESLLSSTKDHAELHMIVDLMRNDLNRICLQGSVNVEDSGSLHSFRNVHHLIARVSGRMEEEQTLGDVLKAMCPGGSITGAPKVEVMKAIREYEDENRGFFMGNICYFDPYTKYFDSSILIRTVSSGKIGSYRFAAGSGLTINSNPLNEWEEILAKASIVVSS